jgi:hypothetical protein
MSVTTADYITTISLGLSVLAIVLVIYFQSRVREPSPPKNHNLEASENNAIEVSAIVSEFGLRLKRLEEGLVDLKVKLEILDLRFARRNQVRADSRPPTTSRYESSYEPSVEPAPRSSVIHLDNSEIVSRVPPSNKISQETSDKRPGGTELEALRIVFEGHGRISAKEIQQKIDRTREHTARMMSSLYREGLVERDVTARPFSYSITQKGRDLLNS